MYGLEKQIENYFVIDIFIIFLLFILKHYDEKIKNNMYIIMIYVCWYNKGSFICISKSCCKCISCPYVFFFLIIINLIVSRKKWWNFVSHEDTPPPIHHRLHAAGQCNFHTQHQLTATNPCAWMLGISAWTSMMKLKFHLVIKPI